MQASSDISGTNPSGQTSPDAGSPAKADLPVKEAPTMRQTHESPQLKRTAVEEILTLQPQQTVVTRSGSTSVRPSRFDDFVT